MVDTNGQWQCAMGRVMVSWAAEHRQHSHGESMAVAKAWPWSSQGGLVPYSLDGLCGCTLYGDWERGLRHKGNQACETAEWSMRNRGMEHAKQVRETGESDTRNKGMSHAQKGIGHAKPGNRACTEENRTCETGE